MFKLFHSHKSIYLGILVIGFLGIGVWIWAPQSDNPESPIDAVKAPTEKQMTLQTDTQIADVTGQDNPKPEKVDRVTKVKTADEKSGNQDGTLNENELKQKSLQELIAIIDEIDVETIRKPWFLEKVRKEINNFKPDSEEKLKLEEAWMRAYPEEAEKYEKETGRPHPPPGHTYVSFDDKSDPVLVRFNTPIVGTTTREMTGYENWDRLSNTEWERYKVLNAISQQTLGQNRKMSREIIELAAKLKKPLYEKSWGTRTIEVPTIVASYNREKTKEDKDNERQLLANAQSNQKSNLPNVSHRIDQKLVDKVLTELKETLNTR